MLQLAGALVAFYFMHSALAANPVKRFAAEVLGLDRWYRLVYTILSFILALWVVQAYLNAPTHRLFQPPGPMLRVFLYAKVAGGGMLAMVAILRLGGAGFIGLQREPETGLVRAGLHGHVRHPIYSGIILMALGWLLLDGRLSTLIVVGTTFLYLPIGIHFEERKLIDRFGESYLRYKREVPALFPKAGSHLRSQ